MTTELKPFRDVLLSVRAIIESTNTIAESDLKLIYNDLSDAIMELENTRQPEKDHLREDWISPIKEERDYQIAQIRKLWPNFDTNVPNWQVMNGLIHYALIGAGIDGQSPDSYRWISVDERVPEPQKNEYGWFIECIVSTNGRIYVYRDNHTNKDYLKECFVHDSNKVLTGFTHWMKPEPPKDK